MPEDLTRTIYAGRHLLDHQIVGLHGELIGKVDDLEFSDAAPGQATIVTALLSGQIAFGQRMGGLLGRWARTSAQRLRGQRSPESRRFDVALLNAVGHTVELNVPAAELPPADLEVWLAQHFVGRIPGS
jgi:hypothetical protein